ncbi:acyl-CoA dehydrogenase family protein [Mycolicibacterium thermoresistibile]
MTTLDSMVDPDLQSLIDSVVAVHDCADDRQLWQTLVEVGLAHLTVSEERGGSGASWPEAAALIRALARHGCTLDVAESDLVAGWLLEQAGAPAAQAVRCALIADIEELRTPTADEESIAITGLIERVALVGRDGQGYYVSDVPVAELHAEDHERHRLTDEAVGTARTRRALARAVRISATLEAITEQAIDYAQTREQFGRPIGRQQAVQRMIAIAAGETALARAATDAAVLAATDSDTPESQVAAMVAVARSCCGHAVDPVVRHAHQVIGAIGTTREHPLHVFTSAALTLRSEDVATRDWDAAVLDLAIRAQPLSDLNLTPASTK